MSAYTLKHWEFVKKNSVDGYEVLKLQGYVYNHTTYPDGTYIVSSTVKNINKNVITTKTGHKYILTGSPCNKYFIWLVENNYADFLDQFIKTNN